VTFSPECENHLLGRWFPNGVPVRRGVPDAGEIGLRLMLMSRSRAKGSDGRIEEAKMMFGLAQHLDAKYGRRLAH